MGAPCPPHLRPPRWIKEQGRQPVGKALDVTFPREQTAGLIDDVLGNIGVPGRHHRHSRGLRLEQDHRGSSLPVPIGGGPARLQQDMTAAKLFDESRVREKPEALGALPDSRRRKSFLDCGPLRTVTDQDQPHVGAGAPAGREPGP